MSSPAHRDKPLAPAAEALGVYLDALLSEGAEPPPPVGMNRVEVSPGPTRSEPPTPPPPAPPKSEPAPPPVEPAMHAAAPTTPAGVVPPWALAPFSVSLFRAAGLHLGLPQGHVKAVLPEPQILAGQGVNAGVLGQCQHLGRTVNIVDLGHWLLPPDRRPAPAASARFALLVDPHWALACDALLGDDVLDPQQVRWRSAMTQRRWLAGTVSARALVLLDIAGFLTLLTAK